MELEGRGSTRPQRVMRAKSQSFGARMMKEVTYESAWSGIRGSRTWTDRASLSSPQGAMELEGLGSTRPRNGTMVGEGRVGK